MLQISSFIFIILLSSSVLAAERSVFMMGTILDLEVKVPAGASHFQSREELVLESMIEEVRKVEQCISTWIPKSDLSKLNASDPEKAFLPSETLSNLLLQVRTRAESFKPFFSPYLGPLIRAWGLRTGGRSPSREEIHQALQDSNENSFRFLSSGKIIRTHPGAAIEEGGFGKGLALDRAMARVMERKKARGAIEPEVQIRLNFGGQVLVAGQSLIPIQVSNPTSRAESLLEFSIKKGSVSTSGNGEHGMKVGHLLDPRTGLPAPFFGSVTAIAETGLDAELLSKVFVLGKADGMKWANLNQKEILWILPSSASSSLFKAYPSCSWSRDLKVISKKVTIVREPCATEKKGEPT